MRKFLKSLILCVSLVAIFSAVACGGDNNSTSSSSSSQQNPSSSGGPVQYSIIFKQAGQDDIIRYVNKGEDLVDIPVCVEKRGYTIAWDRTDFSNINENIVVNAVEDANEYKIYYQGIIQDYIPSNVALEYDEEKEMYYAVVEYDASYTLVECKNGQYITTAQWKKDGVVYQSAGTYQEIEDITLVPVWEDSRENEDAWSDWYE